MHRPYVPKCLFPSHYFPYKVLFIVDYMKILRIRVCWADDTIERQPVLKDGTISPAIDGGQKCAMCGDSYALIQVMHDHSKNVTMEVIPTDRKFKKISLDLLRE